VVVVGEGLLVVVVVVLVVVVQEAIERERHFR
jgi:hypothetical protein